MPAVISPYPPELTLYYSPKACSLAAHIALEESCLPYTAVPIDIRAAANSSAVYRAMNPNGTVPLLNSSGILITESQAILSYVADLVPELDLLPRPGTRRRAKAHEWMNWTSSSLHATYRSIFRPDVYAGDDPAAAAQVRRYGQVKLARMLVEIEARLGDSPYAVGQFSVVDAYLLVFYLWSFDERIDVVLPDRPRYCALAERVWSRSSVKAVVARERAVRRYALPPNFAQRALESDP